MLIFLTNSLSRKVEQFTPIDPHHVKMYACGPTVYDKAHIGNMRAAVVYDMLYRMLKRNYPKVTYARNITDVDDKIINAVKTKTTQEMTKLTKHVTELYHQDTTELGCLMPDIEPRATDHIKQMIDMIDELIKKGHAYEAQNHVLFSTNSYSEYGHLARRSIDEMIMGARVEVAPYKRAPQDFVLWKPSNKDEEFAGFDSPWGHGRPGWHIECSAMCKEHLGEEFDIHGGGADLMFPHHENEIAQSVCANNSGKFARYWVHNGFLTVDGEKMSKSLNNFKTAREVLQDGITGPALRYFYLSTHYRKPLDFNTKALSDAMRAINKFQTTLKLINTRQYTMPIDSAIDTALRDDLNTPKAISILHEYASEAAKGDEESALKLLAGCNILGISLIADNETIPKDVLELAAKRAEAKHQGLWDIADAIRNNVKSMGYDIIDEKNGTYTVVKTNHWLI